LVSDFVDVFPFPKSQRYVRFEPLERLVNSTSRGAHPEVTSAVKFAVWALAAIVHNNDRENRVKKVLRLSTTSGF
jgi:hypothetical protein